MKIFLATAFLVCITTSCSNKDSDPPKQITISGYTATDGNGNIMGSVDASDWLVNATWGDKENNLFTGISSGDLTGTSTGTITISPAYPNPCFFSFGIHIQTTAACKMRFVVVDDRLRVYESGALSMASGSNNFGVTMDADNLPEGMYRIYYTFDAQGSPMFVKGHGDISVLN